jgi:plasmid stability protein
MASITIRNLDDTIKARLHLRAAQHGWSMEQEVREIFQQSLLSAVNEARFAQRLVFIGDLLTWSLTSFSLLRALRYAIPPFRNPHSSGATA